MSQREFNHLLESLAVLSPDQLHQLRRQLDSQLAVSPSLAEETAFDVLSRAGLIGCVEGASHSPTDLGTNPAHMQGFGRD
jgi:hypothetical protein